MKKKPSTNRSLTGKAVPRREALKGIGAFALAAPSLAAIGCSSDSMMGNPLGAPAGTGAAGTPPASGAAGSTGAAGGMATGTGAAGRSTGAAGMSSGAAGATPTPPAGAAGRTSAAAGGPSTPVAGQGSTAGAGGGASGTGSGMAGTGMPTGGMGAASGGGDFIPVTFDTVPSCTLTQTDPAGEGPFFIHEDEVMNDMSLMRADMREDKPGIEMQLNLRVLDSEGMCMKGISGVEVYVWHTDALGFYSGFANQDPNKTYTGGIERTVENMDRFCRGIQVTDEMGVVKFKTVYPGWYNGRAIHIHFVALRKGSTAATTSYRDKKSMIFTTQMYFQEQFSRMIHEANDPYKSRASGTGYNQYVKPQNMVVVPSTRMEGKVVVAALNIVTAGTGSRR